MNTSLSRASRRAPSNEIALQPFPYESVAGGPSLEGLSRSSAAGDAAVHQAEARVLGRQEGEAEARRKYEEQLSKVRADLASALSDFRHDRSLYFERVEAEVVQLALSIARKILHREAQVDPMLLAGMVRVALEKIDGATEVRLHLHPQNAESFSRYLAAQLTNTELPKIIEDPSLTLHGCILETSMGKATMGLDVQLKEIENGLIDLLAIRPKRES